jgi:ankyrin repeat protein
LNQTLSGKPGAVHTPLLVAVAFNKNLEVLTVLLDAGADANARVENGQTPLLVAAMISEDPDVLTLLLEAGADGTTVNDDGKTPFDRGGASFSTSLQPY